MESQTINLRAWYPFASPFQNIQMDESSVSVEERGVVKQVAFTDISKIRIQSFSYAHRDVLLGRIQDVTLVLKSGEEVGLFNCKKSIIGYFLESVKKQNLDTVVETLPDSGNYMAGFSLFNLIRDARRSAIEATLPQQLSLIWGSFVSLLIIIVCIFFISLLVIKFLV